jgi:hypothetical protein
MGSCHSGSTCHRNGNDKRTGQDLEKEVSMRFLLIVLAIHFTVELISNKRKTRKEMETNEMNEPVRHPAEFELR